jgi:hypothetical protein
MRYVVATISGALLAIVPLLLLIFPDVAWDIACGKVLENPPASWRVGELVENRCERIDESVQSLLIGLLIIGTLVLGCVASGALAARVAEGRRMVVAFLAPFLGYVVLLLLGGSHSLLSAVMVFVVGTFAGFFGMAGASWKHLTHAWSAPRSKQRAPQA